MKTVKEEYKKQRKEGYEAQKAFKQAKIAVQFESNERCRLRWIPDQEIYDSSYLLTWGLTENQLKKEENKILKLIEDLGTWGLVGEIKCPCCEEWTQIDSVWAFIGQKGNGYEFDIMQNCLDTFSQ